MKNRKYIKKISVIVCGLVLLAIGYFIVSTFEYQSLINQGSKIADDQCMKVNPLIIQRKNSFLDSMKILLGSGSAAEYWKENNKYLKISQQYVDEQNAWLKEEKTYMDQWNYKSFVPSYIRLAAKAQYNSREAEAKSQQAIIEEFRTKDTVLQKKLSDLVIAQTKKSGEENDLYNKTWNSPKPFDLRDRFTKVPQTICPDENFNIPDVPDFLHPSPPPVNPDQPVS